MAIPTFVFPTPNTRGHLVMFIITGILAPLLTLVGYRDHLRTSKVTSAIWFELSWTSIILLVDFVVAVSFSALPDVSKVMIGFAFVQTVTMMVYVLALGGLVWLQHRRFLNVAVWKLSVQTVQWLRSSDPVTPGNPQEPPRMSSGNGKAPILPPWDVNYNDMHEIKLDSGDFASPISPDKYVNAHPFWQVQVQRQVVVEQDVAYVAQRHGLAVEANMMRPHFNKPQGSGHAKKLSIRELGISKPMPAASTIRRANTLAAPAVEHSRRHRHQQSGSIDAFARPVGRGPALRLQLPSPTLDVPEDVVKRPAPAAKAVHPNPSTRSLGLASRTLVGSSRPKASGTRAYVNTSKPLPSPPPYEGSEVSLPSSGPSQGSHNFVMAMAHRVKISASQARPQMVQTPKAAETPIEYDEKFFL